MRSKSDAKAMKETRKTTCGLMKVNFEGKKNPVFDRQTAFGSEEQTLCSSKYAVSVHYELTACVKKCEIYFSEP